MKKIMTMLCAAIAACAAFAALTPAQRSYFRNKRICVSRDTTTLPGYVITTWHRNGKPDTKAPAVVTNKLQRIVGREQKNPIQTIAEQWKAAAENWKTNAAQWQAEAETNAAAAKVTKDIRKAAKRAEKNLSKIMKTIEHAKKKAGSEDEAELYDLLIEILSDPEKEDD